VVATRVILEVMLERLWASDNIGIDGEGGIKNMKAGEWKWTGRPCSTHDLGACGGRRNESMPAYCMHSG
jgi:hypothetical protein